MFRLHETTRRRIGRAAFGALCAAPTLAVAFWILRQNFPGCDERQAERLAKLLEVKASLDDWRQPRPGSVRTSRLSLDDPSTNTPLASVNSLEWRHAGASCAASAEAASIGVDGLKRLPEHIDRWLTLLPKGTHQFRCKRLAFWAPGATADPKGRPELFGLDDVQISIERQVGQAVRVRLTGRRQQWAPLQVDFDRSAAGDVRISLDATKAAIPAQLLAGFAPGFDSLGPEATFSGVIGVQIHDGVLSGGAAGRLQRADLAAALPMGSPHAIRGDATIELTELRWRNRQIECLAGRVRMEGGCVSPSLLAAAGEYLRCVSTREAAEVAARTGGAEMIAVDQLACQFRLDADGLAILGESSDDAKVAQGCLISHHGRPLVFEPVEKPLPASAWIAFLVGRTESWLPATREAVEMAERLPLPGGDIVRR